MVIGDGDYIGIKIADETNFEIIDCNHELIPAEWNAIGDFFEEFMEKLIDSEGEKYYL